MGTLGSLTFSQFIPLVQRYKQQNVPRWPKNNSRYLFFTVCSTITVQKIFQQHDFVLKWGFRDMKRSIKIHILGKF